MGCQELGNTYPYRRDRLILPLSRLCLHHIKRENVCGSGALSAALDVYRHDHFDAFSKKDTVPSSFLPSIERINLYDIESLPVVTVSAAGRELHLLGKIYGNEYNDVDPRENGEF